MAVRRETKLGEIRPIGKAKIRKAPYISLFPTHCTDSKGNGGADQENDNATVPKSER